MIGKSDNCNTTVIVTREEYFSSMIKMFDDEKTYKKMPKDVTAVVEKQCKHQIKEFVEEGVVTEIKAMIIKNNIATRAFDLRKTHKVCNSVQTSG